MHHHPTPQIGLLRLGVLDIRAAGGVAGSVDASCLVIVPPRVPHNVAGYHVSVRRNAAFKLIEQGLSVAEASLEAGFHDQSHFTQHAKSILAMGPGSWRLRRLKS